MTGHGGWNDRIGLVRGFLTPPIDSRERARTIALKRPTIVMIDYRGLFTRGKWTIALAERCFQAARGSPSSTV